tara:strand:+ start:138 stop:389 length:252 start_codon:yes stop_codon:yes gene_type:complete
MIIINSFAIQSEYAVLDITFNIGDEPKNESIQILGETLNDMTIEELQDHIKTIVNDARNLSLQEMVQEKLGNLINVDIEGDSS